MPKQITRNDRRRLREITATPEAATDEDVELLLAAHAVSQERAAETVLRAVSIGVDPSAMWEWVMAFDGAELAWLMCSTLPDVDVEAALNDGLAIHRALSR